MSDIKDDDSSEENEERRRRNQKRLERSVMPEGVRGVRSGPTKFPAPRANFKVFKEWARRRDLWHIEDWPVLLLGFRPVDVKAHCWPAGFEDSLNDIMEAAGTSIKAGRLREWESPRNVLVWAREKGYPIPKKLEEFVNRFHPKAEGRPQAGAENSDLIRQNETPAERHARIAARHQELKAGGNRHPTKTVAEEEGFSENWVRQLIRKARKSH